ncbi:MAG: hypothetical protein ACOX2L_11070 [Anaerolineae bacterium]|jgi:hypothetical protein|nr:hypothetical protein [Chloroflexota bacterium]
MSPHEEPLPSYVNARARILAAYLRLWATEVLASEAPTHPALPARLAYLDLYGGASRLSARSRAMLAAATSAAADDPVLRSELGIIANAPGPQDPDVAQALRATLGPASRMTHAPQLLGQHHGARVDARLDAMRPLATVAWVEPDGYLGLAGGDAWRCLRRPAMELFLVVRYPLINMGATNADVAAQLDSFWGAPRAALLRESLVGLGPQQRLHEILDATAARLRERGAVHIIPFFLRDGHRLQEILFFASGDVDAYTRAKEVLARFSTGREQGVPNYTWDPVAARYRRPLELVRPLDALANDLGRRLANQIVTAEEIYQRHHVGQPYVLQNYVDALEWLAARGRAYRMGRRMRILR